MSMRGGWPARGGWASIAAAAVLLGGCTSPAAQQRIDERWAAVGRTWDKVVASESVREARLQRGVVWIEDELIHREFKFERSLRGTAEWWNNDVQRFEERDQAYREKAGDMLGGKPENIEPHAIRLFF